MRVIGINQSFWLDEAITGVMARDLNLNDLFTHYFPLDNHPPFYLLIIYGLFQIFPNTEIVARIPSLIFGLTSIIIIYNLGKELTGEKSGVIASLLLTLSPIHIYYSQENRMYSLTTMLVLLVVLNFIFYIKNLNKKSLALYTISSILLLYSDYLPCLIFLVTNFYILFYKKFNRLWLFSQLTIVISFIPWIPIFIKQFFGGVTGIGNSEVFDLVLGKFSYKAVPILLEKLSLGRIPIEFDWTLFLVLPSTMIFILIATYGLIKSKVEIKVLLSAWFVLSIIIGLIVSIFIPVFNYFRFLFILPSFLILISLGIINLPNKYQKNTLLIIVIINVFAIFTYYLNPQLQREQWKQAVEWINENKHEKTIILFANSDPFSPYTWYDKNRVNVHGAFNQFYNKENDYNRVSYLVSTTDEVYLITYLQDITDPQRKLQSWLEQENFVKLYAKPFIGVGSIDIYTKER